MIDIHTHILPGVDDGANNIVESINIIKLQVIEGVTDIVLTPHYNKGNYLASKADVIQAYDELKYEVKKQDINIKLHLGQEIMVASNIFDIIYNKEILTMANSRYLLLELDRGNLNDIDSLIYEIKLLGYIPILAHLENYTKLYKKKSLIDEIIKEGVLIQVNAESIIDKNKSIKSKFCKYLMTNKLVSFIASDCHNTTDRSPNMMKCYKIIKSEFGKKYADKIFIVNPKKMLENKIIDYKYIKKSRLHSTIKSVFGMKNGEVF